MQDLSVLILQWGPWVDTTVPAERKPKARCPSSAGAGPLAGGRLEAALGARAAL